MTACDKGDHAEFLFCAAAAGKGYKILVPWGHSGTSDIWVMKPPSRPISIQIKRAWYDAKRKNYGITVARGCEFKSAYKRGDFDILAAYLPDQDKFVLWTFGQVAGRKRIAYTQHCADQQPDNWDVLDRFVARQKRDIITVQPCS